jgi:hypothetical protein
MDYDLALEGINVNDLNPNTEDEDEDEDLLDDEAVQGPGNAI